MIHLDDLAKSNGSKPTNTLNVAISNAKVH